jgi:CheY-like chemotaxis protein
LLKVLIVEDEADGQEVLMYLLQRVEIATESAKSAEEALKLLAQHDYSAVIIDLMLPGMDGLELLRIIRHSERTAQLPCIAVTAFHSSHVKKQALDIGFDAYFSKPLDTRTFGKELLAILQR